MLGWDVAGFADIQATALNAAIGGSIFAVPDACFVMTMALPFGSTRALLTAHAISTWPPLPKFRKAFVRVVVHDRSWSPSSLKQPEVTYSTARATDPRRSFSRFPDAS